MCLNHDDAPETQQPTTCPARRQSNNRLFLLQAPHVPWSTLLSPHAIDTQSRQSRKWKGAKVRQRSEQKKKNWITICQIDYVTTSRRCHFLVLSLPLPRGEFNSHFACKSLLLLRNCSALVGDRKRNSIKQILSQFSTSSLCTVLPSSWLQAFSLSPTNHARTGWPASRVKEATFHSIEYSS